MFCIAAGYVIPYIRIFPLYSLCNFCEQADYFSFTASYEHISGDDFIRTGYFFFCPVQEKEQMCIRDRMRILADNGFYGLLLMHMGYGVDENCSTAATDGKKIIFGPVFLEEISDRELDFVMMHEVLHVVLQHFLRQGKRDGERFNIACDIVVNSNILFSQNMDARAITCLLYTSTHWASS